MGVFTTAARTWAAAEVLAAANLNAQLRNFIDGFGAWTSYTPTWTASGTAVSLGNGTITGSYCQVNKLVLFTMTLTAGSTTTYGTGYYTFSLPVTLTGTFRGALTVTDSSASAHYVGVTEPGSGTTFVAYTGSTIVGQTSPMTWASGDSITVSGAYQAA